MKSALIVALTILDAVAVRGSLATSSFFEKLLTIGQNYTNFEENESVVGPFERIVGGQNTARGEVPFQALIEGTWDDGRKTLCGGALVTTTDVFTAASCIISLQGPAVTTRIALGVYDRSNNNEAGRVTFIVSSTSYHIHPSFNLLTNRANLAFITLPSSVTITSRIKTIPIANPQSSFVGKSATVTGWGLTGEETSRYLQKLTGRIIPNTNCATFYSGLEYYHVCLLAHTGAGTCEGDTGSPLTALDSDNKRYLVGIAAFEPRRLCGQGRRSVFSSFASEDP